MRFLLCALIALLLTAGATKAQEAAPPTDIQPDQAASSVPVVLSQGDARWKNLRLGNGTVAKQGCLFMTISMITMEQGATDNPRQLITLLARYGMMDRYGRLRMQSLANLFPFLRILDRQPISHQDDTGVIQDWLSQGAFVLLRLNHAHGARGSTQHWVRATKVDEGNLIVVDPNGGKVGSVEDLYGPHAVKEMVVLGKG